MSIKPPGSLEQDAPPPVADAADGDQGVVDETKRDSAGNPLPRVPARVREIGGPPGPEPTRYGDWQFNGRVTDF